MKTKLNKVLTSLILAMALVVGSAMPAFAAETTTNDVVPVSSNAITLSGGAETPLFNNGNLTFTNKYTSDTYYVQGQWLKLSLGFGSASNDQGISGIRLTIDVINADNDQVIYTVQDYVPTKGDVSHTDFTFDLGSGANKVRNIKFRFDASSYGQSNGHYRSATLTDVTAYVFGNP